MKKGTGEDYLKRQKLNLRRVKKDIYNKLTSYGLPRGQAAYAEYAKLFHSWYSVESIRQDAKLIMSKVYSDRFIPSAKDAFDSHHQNNLICCCLMQLIAPPNIIDITLPLAVYFMEINNDEGLRIETQSLIYSRLSQLLDKPIHKVSYHDNLIKQILRLEHRVRELEKHNEIST